MCRSQVAMLVLKITRRFPNSSRLSNRLIIRLGLRNITRRIRMVRIRMNKVRELIRRYSQVCGERGSEFYSGKRRRGIWYDRLRRKHVRVGRNGNRLRIGQPMLKGKILSLKTTSLETKQVFSSQIINIIAFSAKRITKERTRLSPGIKLSPIPR